LERDFPLAKEGYCPPTYVIALGQNPQLITKSQKYGYVVGVTRNCVVTVFSRTDLPDFKRYVKNEILPLISEQ
jgi:hypothetical protein